jgi:hypothetical protein
MRVVHDYSGNSFFEQDRMLTAEWHSLCQWAIANRQDDNRRIERQNMELKLRHK